MLGGRARGRGQEGSWGILCDVLYLVQTSSAVQNYFKQYFHYIFIDLHIMLQSLLILHLFLPLSLCEIRSFKL